MRLHILMLPCLFVLLLPAACAPVLDSQDPASDSQAFRDGFFWERPPLAPVPVLTWDDLSIVIALGINNEICTPDIDACSEQLIWQGMPLIMRQGMIEHLGTDIPYLRGAPSIEATFDPANMQALSADLGRGDRDLIAEPMRWNELEAAISEGVSVLDTNNPGGLRARPVLNWREFEDVVIEGLDWLTTQDPPQ